MSGVYDYLSLSAFAHLEDEFEAAAAAAFKELTRGRKLFRAWDQCTARMYVESKIFDGRSRTYGVNRVSLHGDALDATIRIRNADWWGKPRARQRRLFQGLMTELSERYVAWAERKGLNEEAQLLRDGFALAIEIFEGKRFAKRAKRARDPYAPGGCCYDPDLIEVVSAKPNPKPHKRSAKPNPRKQA